MMRDPSGLVLPALLAALLAAAGGGGCYPATGPAPGDTAEQERFWTAEPVAARTEALRTLLAETCPAADPAEAAEVAGVTVRYGELLKHEYDLTRPPEHHNIAVRLGIKKRGLCYELADDLYARLRAMRLKTFDLHLVQADAGHITDEHNCVVVTDRGKPMPTGVVLDLWRYAGKARFLAVAKDHHEWHELPRPRDPPALVVDDTGMAGKPTVVNAAPANATPANAAPAAGAARAEPPRADVRPTTPSPPGSPPPSDRPRVAMGPTAAPASRPMTPPPPRTLTSTGSAPAATPAPPPASPQTRPALASARTPGANAVRPAPSARPTTAPTAVPAVLPAPAAPTRTRSTPAFPPAVPPTTRPAAVGAAVTTRPAAAAAPATRPAAGQAQVMHPRPALPPTGVRGGLSPASPG